MEYCSAIKTNEVLMHAITWWTLETLCEKKSVMKEDILYDYIDMKCSE